ncbi:MAG: hypothetical protein H0V88_04185 [Pyrinomonadaceae bacterium]|nr:hypothetical protein [Pyrinomonadaceae bacterium]
MFQPFRKLFILSFACAILLLPSAATTFARDEKTATAEQVAETVVFVYGRRELLAQIRRNGVERGRITRSTEDGRIEEIAFERRFVRGENSLKDKIRLDQKMPAMEYSLVYNDGRIWGVINGSTYTPRQEATEEFLQRTRHDIDALLRYKENNSTLTLVGKDKQKNIDFWILDVVDKEKQRTRYYISSKTGRILWLEYELPAGGGQNVKYKKTFHNYNYIQSTLVPYRTVLYANDKQVEEARLSNAVYGIKMDDSLFQNEGS